MFAFMGAARRAERVVIKMVDKTRIQQDKILERFVYREVSVMEQLNHPNIVRIYEVVETLDTLNMVLELCPGSCP